MNEAKHTPGPWKVKDKFFIHVDNDESWSHAEMKSCPGIPADSLQHEANAHLMATAPELLAYAEAVNQWEADMILSQEAWGGGMREFPTFTEELWDRWLELQAMRNAAVMKAKGVGTQ